MIKPILKVLSGEQLETPPVWFMRQAGRHLPEYKKLRTQAKDFIDFCFQPEMAAEATLQPIRRYKMDAAILFADILLIPIGLGRKVTFVPGTGPVLDPLKVTDVEKLELEGAADRISNVFETVKRVSQELDDQTTLIGFCGGPWTVATYMIEGKGSSGKEVAKRFAMQNPKEMEMLLNKLADASADYLIGQAKAGAEVLKIFESWAEGLSPAMFETCVIKPTVRMIERVRSAGIKQPIIGFPRGAGLNMLSFAQQVDVTGLAIGTDTSLTMARDMLGDQLPLQGNLDPLALRIGGSVLKTAVQKVLDDARGPHIFNLGHGVAPDVKIKNVEAVLAHIRTGKGDYV
ncbi:MAG: uroporphyrinogen decarboxylase [Desulfobacterales bacterium]|nr:uroporphyrinogen decarboxylase [Desulfobacterales bacterium]